MLEHGKFRFCDRLKKRLIYLMKRMLDGQIQLLPTQQKALNQVANFIESAQQDAVIVAEQGCGASTLLRFLDGSSGINHVATNFSSFDTFQTRNAITCSEVVEVIYSDHRQAAPVGWSQLRKDQNHRGLAVVRGARIDEAWQQHSFLINLSRMDSLQIESWIRSLQLSRLGRRVHVGDCAVRALTDLCNGAIGEIIPVLQQTLQTIANENRFEVSIQDLLRSKAELNTQLDSAARHAA